MGKKSWDPGRNLQTFLTAILGLPAREQAAIVDQIGTAMADVGPQVREAMDQHPGSVEIGKRMLLAWREGIGWPQGGSRHWRNRRVDSVSGVGTLYDSTPACNL